MKHGLERLFWVLGGILVLPFIVQQSIVFSHNASPRTEAARLRAMPIASPALATAAGPATTATEISSSRRQFRLANESAQFSAPDTSLWSPGRIAAWGESINLLDQPIGALLIPALDLEVPIFSSTSEVALTLGAGLIPGTADLDAGGNIGVASHRDGYFRHLKNVAVGDLLLLKTDHNLRQYRVVDTRIVEPTDTWVLDARDKPLITLVTCYPFRFVGDAPQRYIVSAQEVQSELTNVRHNNFVIGGQHETLKF